MRGGRIAIAAAVLLACSREPSVDVAELERAEGRERSGEREVEDERQACVRAHAGDPAYAPIVRALCAELHDLGGVSASVAIVRDDRVVWSLAVGPRCHGRAEGLRPATPLRIGSVTKLVTAALALVVAEREGVGLDDPLTAELPELSPAPTLRQLLTHTSGLRDPDPTELLVRGDAWPAALQPGRAAAGGHGYANANFLLVGRWLERTSGRRYAELWAQEPALAAVRARVSLDRTSAAQAETPAVVAEAAGIPADGVEAGAAAKAFAGASIASSPSATTTSIACTHQRGWNGEWEAIEASAVPPLPAWTLPAGGGLASAEDLARLPFALEQTGVLASMLATRVPSDLAGWDWDYGLGVRMRGEGDALVLAHSGNTGAHWAELQWSPKHRVAVAVLSSTPQAFKATLHAAFTAGVAAAEAP